MPAQFMKKWLPIAAAVVAAVLAVRYLLPVSVPFLLGSAVALLAEPATGKLARHMHRGVAAAVCVSLTLAVLSCAVALVGAIAVRQMSRLARTAPQMVQTARQGLQVLEEWMTQQTVRMPQSVQPLVKKTVQELFSDGSVVAQQVAQRLPGALGATLGTVGSGALGLGTGVVAAFLISARLPQLRSSINAHLPAGWKKTCLPTLVRLRRALGGWLLAQLKLCAITWGIVTVGFLIMGISEPVLLAGLVAIVDAVPILGTGTVLVPWALVRLLQGAHLQAIGLLCTYAAAAMTRTVLEPRLVGRQLGLDPLATLAALYVGYRFWGFGGLLLTPIAASAVKNLLVADKNAQNPA